MKRNQNIQQFLVSKKSKPDEDSELIRAADVSSTSSGSDNVSESDQDDRQGEATELAASPDDLGM